MNAELNADGTVELRIEREFAYPPKTIFEAWLKPEQLSQWMGPNDDINVSKIDVNAVEGGNYHIEFDDANNQTQHQLKGVYKTINRYTELVFTWIWQAPSDAANEETLVTVNFEPTVAGTKLILLHQRFKLSETRDRHNSGWSGTFDKLERRLANTFK